MSAYLLIPQRTKLDCAVATLASITGSSYEKTLMAYSHPVFEKGSTIAQLREAAKKLGFVTTLRRKVDLEDDEGILTLGSPKWTKADHLVLLFAGHIVDLEEPPTIWDAADYLQVFEARVLSLVTFRRDKRRRDHVEGRQEANSD